MDPSDDDEYEYEDSPDWEEAEGEEDDEEDEEEDEEEDDDPSAWDTPSEPMDDTEENQYEETDEGDNERNFSNGQAPESAAMQHDQKSHIQTQQGCSEGRVTKLAAQFSNSEFGKQQTNVTNKNTDIDESDDVQKKLFQDNSKTFASSGAAGKAVFEESKISEDPQNKRQSEEGTVRNSNRSRGRNRGGNVGPRNRGKQRGRGGRGLYTGNTVPSPTPSQTWQRQHSSFTGNVPRRGHVPKHPVGGDHKKRKQNPESWEEGSGTPGFPHAQGQRYRKTLEQERNFPGSFEEHRMGGSCRNDQGQFYDESMDYSEENYGYSSNEYDEPHYGSGQKQSYDDGSQFNQGRGYADWKGGDPEEYRDNYYGHYHRGNLRGGRYHRGRSNYGQGGSRGQFRGGRGGPVDRRSYKSATSPDPPAGPHRSPTPVSYARDNTEVENTPLILEVSGFDSAIDEEVLMMYFESPRKSGGGDIEEFQMRPSKKIATITFKDSSVANAVLQRHHVLGGFHLRVVKQKQAEKDVKTKSKDYAGPKTRAIQVSGFDPSLDKEVLMMYFESTRKSSGGDIDTIETNWVNSTATITFVDTSVTDRVLEKSHCLSGSVLTVIEKKESETKDDSGDSNNEGTPDRVIEVSGFKSTTSEDMLMMYFENKRRSGGGDIADLQMNTKKNKATIIFEDQTVIDSVMEKTHKLEGANLKVIEKKAQPHRPTDSHRILLKGLPEDIQEETFMLYIENRTSIPEDPVIVYGEQPGTAMLYYANGINDLDMVTKRFGEKKFKKKTITAESVKATDCILVQGLKSNTSKDMIELYFENQRKSGGGDVSDVELLSGEENSAFVFFEDWTTVNKVSARSHTLSGQRLTVTAHYECLGTAVSTEGPVPVIPKPFAHSVDQDLMEPVMRKHNAALAEEMKKSNTEVVWPHNGEKSTVLLKPIPNESTDRSMWRQWKNDATKNFSNFIEKFSRVSIQVPKTIWADLSDMLSEIEVGNVSVDPRGDKSIIRLVGESADVSTANTALSKAIQELKDKAEREAKTIEKTLRLSPLKMKLFSLFAISNELRSRFPEVHIQVHPDQSEIGFKGIRGEISESQVYMYGIFESLKNCIFETNANIFEFVEQFCDVMNGVLSTKGINAMCNVEDGKITIYGKVPSDTEKAMKILRADISSKPMPIGKDSVMTVLQSKKGVDKINNLNDKEVVIIHLDRSKRQIRITGLKDKVESAIAEIGKFIDENVITEKLVPFPPLHVKYILANCGKELSEIRTQFPDVNLLPEINGRKSGFMMKGNDRKTDAVIDMLERLKSSIVERIHSVDKPGMPELLRDQKGQRYLKSVAHECECLIDTDNHMEDDVSESSSPITGMSEILCYFTTTDGCRLLVCKGDLTKENVDAIVNAANPRLKHIGGLAKAISQAGGETIQQESNRIIKQRGMDLATSEAVCTGAGHLPCRHVIHVSGPVWPKGRDRDKTDHSHEEDLLYDAVTNCLREAQSRKLTSIALPAISAGVFGFPVKLCAKTVVEATSDFISRRQCTLKEIRFTNITFEHSVAFQNALKDRFGAEVVVGPPTTAKESNPRLLMDGMYQTPKVKAATAIPIPAPIPTAQIMFNKKSPDIITTSEGTDVVLKKGSLANEQADVIVNTTAGEMDLSRGNVSKALLQAAGPGLQQECNVKVTQSDGKRRDVVAGDFIQTGPAKLKCKQVFHSHCPSYKEKDAVKVLQSMIEKLLLQASKSGLTSIAIPAIGTGNLGFPRDVVARVMYEGVAQFSKANPTSTLKDIRFWVYDKDLPTIQAFETEMQRRTASAPTPTTPAMDSTATQKKKKPKRKMKKSTSTISIPVPEPAEEDFSFVETNPMEAAPSGTLLGPSEIKFGSVTVRLQQGDLSTETTDAIVNTVGRDLALKGVVSRALIRAGGSVIADECEQIRKTSKSIPHIAKTTAGKLPSKYIIHVFLSGPDMVKKMAREILQLAEMEGIQSISFPALGTGNLGGSAHQVAPELIDAIGEFATNDKPKNLHEVKLAIFQQDMIPIFEETLKSKAGASFKKPEAAWKRGIKAVLKYATGGTEQTEGQGSRPVHRKTDDEKDSISIYIISKDERKLDKAVTMIEDFIRDEFYSEEVTPEGVEAEFTGNLLRSIKEIGRKHKVTVAAVSGNKGVLLEGAKVSVLNTKVDIHSQFARIQAEEKWKAKDLLLSKEVQWRYQSETGIYDDYDEEINAAIERAYQDKKPSLDLEMEEGTIRIDFNKMMEIDVKGIRPDVSINRADLKTESSNVPSNWIPMAEGQNLQVVALTQGSPEYTQAESTFKSGIFNPTIVKIERIQNKEIYTQYAARKESMKTRLGRDTERILFHGTSDDTVDKINMRGFNRSYCGKNAVYFGKGTYFARDVTYSAQDRYSRRDAKNQKYMYICKVLVGDSEVGNKEMVMPHQKPGSADIYDSTVDNVQNPSVIVIYHDAQAYPEYLITFIQ